MTPLLLGRRELLVAAGAGVVLALAGCGFGQSAARLRMACGEPGGTYVRFGELLRSAVERAGAATMEVLVTDGSVENLAMLASGDAELAIALADAVVAEPQVPGGPDAPVALGRVYQNYLQCVVLAGSGVSTVADLAGLRVSVGAPGSGTALMARRVLDALGLATGVDAAQQSELNLADAVTALAAGEIGALFWSGGIPLPELERLQGIAEVALVDVTDALAALEALHPGVYQQTSVPAGVYALQQPMPTIGVSNLLLARSDLPDAVAAELVDILIEDAQRLVPSPSVGVQYLTASNLIDTAPVALHPAAERRYRERYG